MFSVIIPLYNKALYVEKAVRSVWSQTYRDFELIIVDDGSTDGSLSVVESLCSELSQTDLKAKFNIVSQKNSGVSTARNNGVKSARYPYICFLDADDWWEPTFLAEMSRVYRRISTSRHIRNRLLHRKKRSKACSSGGSRYRF